MDRRWGPPSALFETASQPQTGALTNPTIRYWRNMIDADELQASLLSSRNADGGWPSRRGSSWTEPTALALLALQGTRVPRETRAASATWLARQQSRDGGWPPCPAVPTSTWVTSVALLALAQESEHSQGCPKGALWLSQHVYSELNSLAKLPPRTRWALAPRRHRAVRPGFRGRPAGSYLRPTAFWRCPAGPIARA